MGDALVSLNDILEVRVEGLKADELLALLLKSCEYFGTLSKVSKINGNQQFVGIFSPHSIFLGRNGEIVVII